MGVVPSLLLHSTQYCQRSRQRAPVCLYAPLLETHSIDPSHPDPSPGVIPGEFLCHPLVNLIPTCFLFCLVFYKVLILPHTCSWCHCWLVLGKVNLQLLLPHPVRIIFNTAIATEPSWDPVNRNYSALLWPLIPLVWTWVLFCFDGSWSLQPGIVAHWVHVSYHPSVQHLHLIYVCGS